MKTVISTTTTGTATTTTVTTVTTVTATATTTTTTATIAASAVATITQYLSETSRMLPALQASVSLAMLLEAFPEHGTRRSPRCEWPAQ